MMGTNVIPWSFQRQVTSMIIVNYYVDNSERNLQKPIQGREYRNSKEAMYLLDSEATAEKDREGKTDMPRVTSV